MSRTSEADSLRPIPLWQTALYFGVPGGLIYLATFVAVPRLVELGIPLIWAWSLAVFAPYWPLAIALVVRHVRREGWRSFGRRFRFTGVARKHWKWIALAFPVIILGNFSLEWTQPLLREVVPAQPIIPELFADPYEATRTGGAVGTLFGVPMAGNFWLIPFWLLWAVGGVVMEELIWRGYLLPRMELTYGRRAWLVNGLLWNVPFHLYTLHNVLTDLPMMLIIPWLSQRTGSIWPALLLHGLMVCLAYVIIIPGVFGG